MDISAKGLGQTGFITEYVCSYVLKTMWFKQETSVCLCQAWYKRIMYFSHALKMHGYRNEICYASFVPIYISIPDSYAKDVRAVIREIVKNKPDKYDFHVNVYNLGGKLRKYLPDVLTRKEFITDYIDDLRC